MSLPQPQITAANAPFWEGLKSGQLILPRCRACGALTYFPRAVCLRCMSTQLDWVAVSGHGTVYTFTVTHVPPPGVQADVPYVVATVELPEGARLLTNLVGCEPEEVYVGMPVHLSCRDNLPFFEPDRG